MTLKDMNLNSPYFARERFSLETEARARRVEPGIGSRQVADWCFSELGKRVKSGPILDLACGNGRHLWDLAGFSVPVLGGDFSQSMLREARDRAGWVPLTRFEAERLPFREQSIEATFSGRFLHHLPTREIREIVLSEMFRVSRTTVAITYKSRFSQEHLLHLAKSIARGKPPTRFFSPLSEFKAIADRQGWRVASTFSPGGLLTANRGIIFEPKVPAPSLPDAH